MWKPKHRLAADRRIPRGGNSERSDTVRISGSCSLSQQGRGKSYSLETVPELGPTRRHLPGLIVTSLNFAGVVVPHTL